MFILSFHKSCLINCVHNVHIIYFMNLLCSFSHFLTCINKLQETISGTKEKIIITPLLFTNYELLKTNHKTHIDKKKHLR